MTVELAYAASGTGPALVVLHGLFGSSSNWRGIARALSPQYTVYLVDLRNHGHSPHAAEMTYPELAQDLARLVTKLGLRRFHLVGHSMGGKTAMCFALRGTHPLASLSVVDISPFPSPGDHGPILRALQALPVDEITNRGEADAVLAQSIAEPAMRAFLLQNLMRTPQGRTCADSTRATPVITTTGPACSCAAHCLNISARPNTTRSDSGFSMQSLTKSRRPATGSMPNGQRPFSRL